MSDIRSRTVSGSRKSRKTRAASWALALVLVAAFFAALGLSAGRLLIVDQPPRKADVIVVLGGDTGSRTERAAELYRAGYAPYLIVSAGRIYHTTILADLMERHALERGVPREAIIAERRSESTYQNALFSREIIRARSFRSAIVVSSNYHMRRVKLTFDRVFRDTGVSLVYVAAPDPDFNPSRWWENNKSAMYTITEYIKLAGYILGRAE